MKQSDVYQMLAYAEAWGAGGRRPRLLLLYPHFEALGPEGHRARWVTHGREVEFRVASFDVNRWDAATNEKIFSSAVGLHH